MLCDFDHSDGNSNNRSLDNCQPLSLIAHRLKTKNEEIYKELLNNPDKAKDFNFKLIKEMLSHQKLNPTDKVYLINFISSQ